jgi:branched-chain amino acid transport system substrate-binding protein
MFKLRHKVILLVTLLLIVLSAQVILAQDQPPIQIAVAVAETGSASLFGQEQIIGAQLAVDYYNSLGGVNGRMIELVRQDTASDEAGAIAAFQTLIATDVVGIVGPTLSQQALSADPFAEDAGVPVIAPSNTAPGIPELGNYIARISAPVTVVAPNAINSALAIDPNITDVAVFYAQDDAFASSETTVFQAVVTNLGLNVASVQTHLKADTDFTTQITAALATNPQLVVISGLAADGGALVRQLREFGYTGLIVGGNGFNTPNLFTVCQQYCDGIVVATAYSPLYESEINTAFTQAYAASQEGRTASQFSAQAFTAVQVFVEALINLDNITPIADLDTPTLRSLLNMSILAGGYDTPIGPISFTPVGEIVQNQFYVVQIVMNDDGQTGEFTLLGGE